MLPLIDKPIIQYGVEEAIASGLDKIVIITSRGKESILDHFDNSVDLELSLRTRKKEALLATVTDVSDMIDVIGVRQKDARGLGHAVLMAKDAVGNEPFAVLLPDDVILADPPCLAQMKEVYERTGRPVVALMEVPPSETSRYGIIEGERVDERTYRIRRMVEKPTSNPPSNFAIIGRYILPSEIFPLLAETGEGAGGEIQITDALQKLVESGDFYGYLFKGTRYDAGEKLGYLKATVDYALRHPTMGQEFRAHVESSLVKIPSR